MATPVRISMLAAAMALFTSSERCAAEATVKIVAFGDSTTAVRETVREVYAQRLPGLLAARGIKAEVVNAGVGGSHTGSASDTPGSSIRHALDRLEEVRGQRADWVIVQFGWNDSWVDSRQSLDASRISLESYERNLVRIVDTLRSGGSRVALMTPNPPHTSLALWQRDRTSQYAQRVRDVAARLKTPLLDIWRLYEAWEERTGRSRNELLLDDVHPNDEGHALVAESLAEALAGALAEMTEPAAQSLPRGYSVPLVDLASDTSRQVVVDREQGQYLGHPTTALLDDGRTLLCVYPQGHGRGAIVYKRSSDGGLTWSERLPTPENWATSLEVPTLFRLRRPSGGQRLILFSGMHPVRLASSEDDGQNWTSLAPVGPWGGIVAMSSVVERNGPPGHALALFHDDGRFLQPAADNQNVRDVRRKEKPVFVVYQTDTTDGGLSWSAPRAIASLPDVQLCEPGAVRSPDGKQIAVLLRENSRTRNSFLITSDDEGQSWTRPRELPGALTGDRHTAKYLPDGRLLVSFRDTTLDSPTRGDWVAWLGRYDDVVAGREGQCRIRLMDNHKQADCAYPGVEVLPDGTVVAVTYGHWTPGEAPYIVAVRLRAEEIDRRLASGK